MKKEGEVRRRGVGEERREERLGGRVREEGMRRKR